MKVPLSQSAIEALVRRFQACELPASEWTHEAHLITALYFLKNYNKDEATCWLRGGIIAYNASLGNQNSPTGGYHETLTLCWIAVCTPLCSNIGNLACRN